MQEGLITCGVLQGSLSGPLLLKAGVLVTVVSDL